jgi:hypothetical protein
MIFTNFSADIPAEAINYSTRWERAAFYSRRAHPGRRGDSSELRSQSGVFRFRMEEIGYLTLNSSYLRPRSSVIERRAIEQLAEFE